MIPHRRRRDLLLRLLPALEGWPYLVVDDTDEGLDLDVPRVRLGGGQGFAKAANTGLSAVRTPSAILLNDDALPLDDCLDRLSAAGGLCGPLLVGPHGVESAGIRLRPWGRVVQSVAVPSNDAPTPVDALSGACLHLPSHLRFDEGYRHGYEDVELCRRVGGARLLAGARCWHEGGATVSRRSRAAQKAAVAGQIRLFGGGWRTGVVVGLALAQVARERGPLERLFGVWEGASEPSTRSPRSGSR